MFSRWHLYFVLVSVLTCACDGDNQAALSPVNETTISRAEASVTRIDHVSISTTETIDAGSYGLKGDGVTPNTMAFRNLFATGNRIVRIGRGDYLTGSFVIPANTTIELEPGTTIRDTGQLGPEESFITITSENVRINGLGSRVIADRAHYTTGENRHGVLIYGARRVIIDGLESSSFGGDGFYIGGPQDRPPTDIVLRGCRAENNRRQGLSITSGQRVTVADCEFADTNGTAPESGIDLEPNYPINPLEDIVLLRPVTINNRGSGIMIELGKLDSTSKDVSIAIIDHYSEGESLPLKLLDLNGQSHNILYRQAH